MTTPDEPTRATGESDGPTERVKQPPSLQPRPLPRPIPSKPPAAGPETQPAPRVDGQPRQPADPAAAKAQNGHSRPASTATFQREPQSNLHRPGEAPVTGRPPNPSSTGSVRDPAAIAKTLRKEADRSRAETIDGPTRSIARPELAKDMPDLSEVRHPTPVEHVAAATAPRVIATHESDEPLRATVQLRKIDPWSTLKVSLVISVALFFVWMVAVGLLYLVLDGMGVWDRLNNAFTDIVSESSSDGLVSAGQVFGYSAGIGLINVVLFTALATIGAFIYNQCSDLVGGIEVTLADPD